MVKCIERETCLLYCSQNLGSGGAVRGGVEVYDTDLKY